jgi:NAD(P)H-dependent FMN reductase
MMYGPIDVTATANGRLRLLLLSGSLRSDSSNSRALELAARLSAHRFDAIAYMGLARLPAFNPDVEMLGEADPDFPAPVRALRAEIALADALLVSTPEYAHGMPGSLKNALDWLVGSSGFTGLPVGVINVSPRSHFATPQTIEVMRTMSAEIVEAACLTTDRSRADEAAPEQRWPDRLSCAMDALYEAAARLRAIRAHWRGEPT